MYIARIEGKSGYVVLKRVAVPDNERLRTIEKEIAFMVHISTSSSLDCNSGIDIYIIISDD